MRLLNGSPSPGGDLSLPSQRPPLRIILQGKARAIPAVLGSVLLAAAGLKTHQLLAHPSFESEIFQSRWFLIGLIELEFALGLCLLLGIHSRQMRIAAIVCYAAFAAASFQQALAGRASCSCFGAMAIRPWYTFLFDLAAVAALWHWHPDPSTRSACEELRAHFSRPLFSITLAMLCLPAGFFAVTPWFQASPQLLTVHPKTIDMGTVQAGGRKEVTFCVTNPRDILVTIARIETSCRCLTIKLPTDLLGPGQTLTGRARIDLATEADFTGEVGVEVKGLNQSGSVLFGFIVNVEVSRGCEGWPGDEPA